METQFKPSTLSMVRAFDLAGQYWTEPRTSALKLLWANGFSATEIAKELRHVTRNAVIGKAHRLGLAARLLPALPPRVRPHRPKPKTRTKPKATPSFPAAAPPNPEALDALRVGGDLVSVLTLTVGMCRYPIGDPKGPGFGFCARAPADDRPYCATHARVCVSHEAGKPRGSRKSPNPDLRLLEDTMGMRNRGWP